MRQSRLQRARDTGSVWAVHLLADGQWNLTRCSTPKMA